MPVFARVSGSETNFACIRCGHVETQEEEEQGRLNTGESLMKGFLMAAGIIAALYVADQLYAHGTYAHALQYMVTQMRHSFGV
jgi:hypothetical protein